MSCTSTNLTIDQGDDKTYIISVANGGVPVDLTGSTFSLIAKVSTADSDDDAVITSSNSTPTDGPGGLTYVSLTNEQTSIDAGTYIYRVKWVDGSGNVNTVVTGNLTIQAV